MYLWHLFSFELFHHAIIRNSYRTEIMETFREVFVSVRYPSQSNKDSLGELI